MKSWKRALIASIIATILGVWFGMHPWQIVVIGGALGVAMGMWS